MVCIGRLDLERPIEISELLKQGNTLLASGKPEEARKVFDRAFRVARAANDGQREMEAGMGLGLAYFVEGQYEKAKKEFKTYDANVAKLELRTEIDMVCTYIQFSRSLAVSGDCAAALDWCLRAMNRLLMFSASKESNGLEDVIMQVDDLLDAAMHMLVEAMRHR